MSSSEPAAQTLDTLTTQDVARTVRIIGALCHTLEPTLSDGKARLVHPSHAQLVRTDAGEESQGAITPLLLSGADAAKDPALDVVAAYVAPEVFAGKAEAVASTVYHVAALAYQLLTGQAPFEGSSPAAIRIKVLLERPQQPHLIRKDLSPALSDVLLAALDKKPDARPKSLRALADALAQAAAEPSRTRIGNAASGAVGLRRGPAQADVLAAAPMAATSPPAQRVKRPVTVLALFAVVAVLVTSGALLLAPSHEDAPPALSMRRSAEAPGAAMPPPPAPVPAPATEAVTDTRDNDKKVAADEERSAPAKTTSSETTSSKPVPAKDKPHVVRKNKAVPARSVRADDEFAEADEKPAPRPAPPRAAPSPAPPGAAPSPAPPGAAPSPTRSMSRASDDLSSEEVARPSVGQSPAAKERVATGKKTVAKPKRVATGTTKSKGGKANGARVEGGESTGTRAVEAEPVLVNKPKPDASAVAAGGEPASGGGEVLPVPAASAERASAPASPRRSKRAAGVALLVIALAAALGASVLLWIIRRDQRLALQAATTQRAGSEADTSPSGKQQEPASVKGAIDPFVVGQYTCYERLGEGGMGMVYKARHTELGKEAAVKVLSPSAMVAPDAIELFEREAKLSSQINHPNSVFIFDHGNVGGALFYLVMEFIDGQSLDEIISPKGKSPRPLPVDRVLHMTKQICSVLDTAHAQGIVHRDLKPHNVMVVNRGDRRDFVKVVDFGIARSMDAAPGRHTASGAVIGTPAYMSPEQAAGDPTIDTRSDIFSLAVMVFHMLSGKIPFADKAKTPIEQLVQRATMREPIGRGTLRAQGNITKEIEAALLHALDPDRSRRPQTAGDFYRALEKAAAA